MAILRATFTAFVDQGATGDSYPVIVEWNSTTGQNWILSQVLVPGGAGVGVGVLPGATVLVIIPPVTNAVLWTINGAGAGPVLSASSPCILPAPVLPFTLVSTAAAIPGFTLIYL